MKRYAVFIAAVAIVLGVLTAQVTPPNYPHPKPRPLDGPMSQGLAIISLPIAPNFYNMENPAVWSIDIGGGLHSRLNESDRLGLLPALTEEGAMVFDAAEQMYYAVDRDLKPIHPLFPWNVYDILTKSAAAVTIYSGDGVIDTKGAGERFVRLGQNRLNFEGSQGPSGFEGQFRVATLGISLSASETFIYGRDKLRLYTPLLATNPGGAKAGMLLSLVNPSSGQVEFVDPLTVSGGNIYTINGALTGARTVDLATYPLYFQSLSPGASFNAIAPSVSLQSSLNMTLQSGGGLKMLIPNNAGGAKNGDVLTMLNTTDGSVEFRTLTIPTLSNIYNSDGTITTSNGSRNVNLGTNVLFFNGGLGTFFVNNVGKAYLLGKTNWVYGQNEWVGGVTGPSAGRVALATAKTVAGTAVNGQVLTLVDAPSSTIEYSPAYNLYNSNGIIAGNRIVEGNFRELSFTNLNVFDARSRTSVLSGQLQLNVRTPNVVNAVAQANQVLTLMDATSGRVEYGTLPADTSIYKGDGATTANRTVNSPFDLTFNMGVNSLFSVQNGGLSRMFSKTNILYSNEELQFASDGRLKVSMQGASSAVNNDVLTLVDRPNYGVAYRTPQNLYNNDGTITANRTLDGNNAARSLTYRGLLNWEQDARYIFLSATNELNLRTPEWQPAGATKANGQVLTLIDSTTGKAEWRNATTGGGPTIYSGDGALAGNRTVSGGSFNLNIFGANKTTGLPADLVHFFGWDRFIANNRTNEFHGNTFYVNLTTDGRFVLTTPRVKANGAASMGGQILTLNANGTADFQPFTPSGVDKSIYSTDDVITGNRIVDVNAKTLIFTNSTSWIAQGIDLGLAASSKFYLKTPAGGTRQGQFLQLVNATTGEAEWQTPTDTSVYKNDGVLLGNRTITATGFDFKVSDGNLVFIHGKNVGLYSKPEAGSTLVISTPNVQKSSATAGQVLTLANATTGEAEYLPIPFPALQNLYTTNGSLNGPRIVSLAGNTLNWNGPGTVNWNSITSFGLSATDISLTASGKSILSGGTVQIKEKTVNDGNGAKGMILTLQDGAGTAEWQPAVQSIQNIYTTDGELTTARTLDGKALDLTFQNIDRGTFSANHAKFDGNYATINAKQGLYVTTPTTAATAAGAVLTLNTDKSANWAAIPAVDTLYSKDGKLGGHRTVTGQNNNLSFNAINVLQFNAAAATMAAQNSAIIGSSSVRIGTPMGYQENVQIGQVLAATSQDGRVEFATLPPDTSIYKGSGDLSISTTVNGGGNKSLTFSGLTQGTMSGVGVSMIGSSDATIQAGSNLRIRTTKVISPGIAKGMVLVAQDNTGKVEFETLSTTSGTAKTIYTDDGALDENRTVTMGAQSLTFSGTSGFTVNSGTATVKPTGELIIGTGPGGQLKIRTPLVQNDSTSAKNGYVLTLGSEGTVEYQSIQDKVGVIEHSGDTDVTTVPNPGTLAMVVPNTKLNPDYTIPSTTEYPDFMRATIRAHTSGGSIVDGQNVTIKIGTGPVVNILNPNGQQMKAFDIVDGFMMELLYDSQLNSFVLLDFGAGPAPNRAAVQMLPPTVRQPRVSAVGVVDIAADLAGAGFDFKMISTLGFTTVGDGKHGSYYVTAYDPVISTAYAVRSTIDPTKMWKKLVAVP